MKQRTMFSMGVIVLVVAFLVVVAAQSGLSMLRFEAEQGSLAGQAAIRTDTLASGGSFLGFDASTGATQTFLAGFETREDFYNRFEYFVGNHCSFYQDMCRLETAPPWMDAIQNWNGDHNMNCEGPTTLRNVYVGNHDEYFWWCAPRGPESGHIMTAQNMTGYGIISFTPKQSFRNISKICWDVNATDMGGGKWTNVVVIPQNEYVRHLNTNPLREEEGEGPYRQDYTTIGFNEDGAPGDFNLQDHDMLPATDIWGFRSFRGTLQVFRDETDLWNNGFGSPVVTTDKAARFKHCLINNPNNTLTLTRARPDGVTDNFTMPGVQIPSGDMRVIFQDDNYDPPKREGYNPNNLTWHWDNIEIQYQQ